MNDRCAPGRICRRTAFACIGICALLSLTVVPQTAMGQFSRYRVMTYNVENLFDTCHDAGHDDFEFQPDAARKWTGMRYWRKLDGICRVLAAAGGYMPVDMVALCEVENDSVVRDLCERTMLRRLGYRYMVTNSADARGMDVALLYQSERFKPLFRTDIHLPLMPGERPTRDVLHVGGLLPTGDTLDVLICHLPSRRGGTREAEMRRRRAAQALRRSADSIRRGRSRALLLMMGDFNDGYRSKSMAGCLGVERIPDNCVLKDSALYVLSANLKARDGICGTYKYRGVWNDLDQIIVSGTLLVPHAAFRTRRDACRIFAPAFLTARDDTQGGVRPRRTYLGPAYMGGISDHLPLLLDFEMHMP